MKGLFKSKPRTPVDIVRQTRDLLLFFDRSTETRESKREEKVSSIILLFRSHFFPFFKFFYFRDSDLDELSAIADPW